jgi:hypothetical protein
MMIELLISAAITMVITGGILALMSPVQGIFHTQPEVSDMQQRLRVGVDGLAKDLIMAGAGTYAGSAAAALNTLFAPVVPYRIGDVNDDRPRNVFFRPDTISIMYVPPTPSQATTAEAMTTISTRVKLAAQSSCPPSTPRSLCDIREDMRLVIFDSRGRRDLVTVTGVEDGALSVEYKGTLSVPYAKGSSIARIAMHTYYLKSDVSTRTFQLMHYDGVETDLPVADHIVDLEFEYYGDPLPPMRLLERPLTGEGPWTTYGPKPPEPGADNAPWPAGENCVFVVDPDSGVHAPRLPVLGGTGTIRLTEPMLKDGPWCPDATARDRFDADLLRIRRVRVKLRVQVARESLRGPAGPLFARGGTFNGATRMVPDQQIQFDVAPRNMNLTR